MDDSGSEAFAGLYAGIFGLVGSLIGGFVAGGASLLVARQTRRAAEREWIRDNRRAIYDRFLTHAQQFLIASQDMFDAGQAGADLMGERERRIALDEAHGSFFQSYGTMQAVAEPPLVDAARAYAYRLLELKDILDSRSRFARHQFWSIAETVRLARHDVIDVMRRELGVIGSARPSEEYNPFYGTPLEAQWERQQSNQSA